MANLRSLLEKYYKEEPLPQDVRTAIEGMLLESNAHFELGSNKDFKKFSMQQQVIHDQMEAAKRDSIVQVLQIFSDYYGLPLSEIECVFKLGVREGIVRAMGSIHELLITDYSLWGDNNLEGIDDEME